MFRWLGALVTAATLSWFAVLLVTGDYYNEGPTVYVLSISYGFGIHRGDVGVVALWAAGMIGLFSSALARRGTAAGRGRRVRSGR